MEKQQIIKGKIDELFINKLLTLEKNTQSTLSVLETMKYDFYDHCVLAYEKLLVAEEEEQEHLETAPNKKIVKKDEEIKKPIKGNEMRSKTPINPSKAKPKIIEKTAEKGHETTRDKERKHSNIQGVRQAREDKEKAAIKTASKKELKKATTINDTKKTPGRKITATKTPKLSQIKKNESDFKETDVKKSKEDDPGNTKEESIKNCINNITIAPQLNPKYIYVLPQEIKENNLLSLLYILTKSNFLTIKEQFRIILSYPIIYKNGYNSSLEFFLENKKEKLKAQIASITTLFSSYGDIESYLSKVFTPSKTAQNSLAFVAKEEELSLCKREDLPKEIGIIFHLIYLIIDEPFDESLPTNQIINHLVNELLLKFDVKDIRNLLLSYSNNKKALIITKEKYEQIDQILKDNPKILSSIDIAKINRPISYMTFFLKEIYDFMGLKTLDGVFYYELRNKKTELIVLQEQLTKLQHPVTVISSQSAITSVNATVVETIPEAIKITLDQIPAENTTEKTE